MKKQLTIKLSITLLSVFMLTSPATSIADNSKVLSNRPLVIPGSNSDSNQNQHLSGERLSSAQQAIVIKMQPAITLSRLLTSTQSVLEKRIAKESNDAAELKSTITAYQSANNTLVRYIVNSLNNSQLTSGQKNQIIAQISPDAKNQVFVKSVEKSLASDKFKTTDAPYDTNLNSTFLEIAKNIKNAISGKATILSLQNLANSKNYLINPAVYDEQLAQYHLQQTENEFISEGQAIYAAQVKAYIDSFTSSELQQDHSSNPDQAAQSLANKAAAANTTWQEVASAFQKNETIEDQQALRLYGRSSALFSNPFVQSQLQGNAASSSIASSTNVVSALQEDQKLSSQITQLIDDNHSKSLTSLPSATDQSAESLMSSEGLKLSHTIMSVNSLSEGTQAPLQATKPSALNNTASTATPNVEQSHDAESIASADNAQAANVSTAGSFYAVDLPILSKVLEQQGNDAVANMATSLVASLEHTSDVAQQEALEQKANALMQFAVDYVQNETPQEKQMMSNNTSQLNTMNVISNALPKQATKAEISQFEADVKNEMALNERLNQQNPSQAKLDQYRDKLIEQGKAVIADIPEYEDDKRYNDINRADILQSILTKEGQVSQAATAKLVAANLQKNEQVSKMREDLQNLEQVAAENTTPAAEDIDSYNDAENILKEGGNQAGYQQLVNLNKGSDGQPLLDENTLLSNDEANVSLNNKQKATQAIEMAQAVYSEHHLIDELQQAVTQTEQYAEYEQNAAESLVRKYPKLIHSDDTAANEQEIKTLQRSIVSESKKLDTPREKISRDNAMISSLGLENIALSSKEAGTLVAGNLKNTQSKINVNNAQIVALKKEVASVGGIASANNLYGAKEANVQQFLLDEQDLLYLQSLDPNTLEAPEKATQIQLKIAKNFKQPANIGSVRSYMASYGGNKSDELYFEEDVLYKNMKKLASTVPELKLDQFTQKQIQGDLGDIQAFSLTPKQYTADVSDESANQALLKQVQSQMANVSAKPFVVTASGIQAGAKIQEMQNEIAAIKAYQSDKTQALMTNAESARYKEVMQVIQQSLKDPNILSEFSQNTPRSTDEAKVWALTQYTKKIPDLIKAVQHKLSIDPGKKIYQAQLSGLQAVMSTIANKYPNLIASAMANGVQTSAALKANMAELDRLNAQLDNDPITPSVNQSSYQFENSIIHSENMTLGLSGSQAIPAVAKPINMADMLNTAAQDFSKNPYSINNFDTILGVASYVGDALPENDQDKDGAQFQDFKTTSEAENTLQNLLEENKIYLESNESVGVLKTQPLIHKLKQAIATNNVGDENTIDKSAEKYTALGQKEVQTGKIKKISAASKLLVALYQKMLKIANISTSSGLNPALKNLYCQMGVSASSDGGCKVTMSSENIAKIKPLMQAAVNVVGAIQTELTLFGGISVKNDGASVSGGNIYTSVATDGLNKYKENADYNAGENRVNLGSNFLYNLFSKGSAVYGIKPDPMLANAINIIPYWASLGKGGTLGLPSSTVSGESSADYFQSSQGAGVSMIAPITSHQIDLWTQALGQSDEPSQALLKKISNNFSPISNPAAQINASLSAKADADLEFSKLQLQQERDTLIQLEKQTGSNEKLQDDYKKLSSALADEQAATTEQAVVSSANSALNAEMNLYEAINPDYEKSTIHASQDQVIHNKLIESLVQQAQQVQQDYLTSYQYRYGSARARNVMERYILGSYAMDASFIPMVGLELYHSAKVTNAGFDADPLTNNPLAKIKQSWELKQENADEGASDDALESVDGIVTSDQSAKAATQGSEAMQESEESTKASNATRTSIESAEQAENGVPDAEALLDDVTQAAESSGAEDVPD